MKLSENKDADIRFRFNPCAVPFIPSIAKERSDMVLSRMDVLHVNTGDPAFWNRGEPVLDGFGKISEMEEDHYISCLPLHMFDSNENEMSEKETFSDDSLLETKLSSWLQDEELFVHSQGGSSICDESWSATPVSSASPPLNEDQDHNSTSYGSLPLSSYASDMAQSELPQEQPELSEIKMDQLQTSDCEARGNGAMRYYSPFETGVSTWLAGEKNTRKGSSRSLKEINGQLPEEMKKDSLKVGNIWNDVCSSKALRSSSSVNSEDDLFVSIKSKDEASDQGQLPFWDFSSSLDHNPWLNDSETSFKSLSEHGWTGQCTKQRNSTTANNKNACLPNSFESNQKYILNPDKSKGGPLGKSQFNQTSRLEPNSRSPHNLPKKIQSVPWLESNNQGLMPDPVLCMPQFGQAIANHSAFPVFYVTSHVPVHQNAYHYPMYNPYVMHFEPQYPGFVNPLPQFYPMVDPLTFSNLGNKNPAFIALNRHSGPSLELHQQLDVCYEQFRQLENERKKAEAEMARQHPGKEVTSDNTMTVPLMPPNPSRIDRLVVEVIREHTRVVTLVSRMTQLRGVDFQPSLLIVFEYWLEGAQNLQTCRKNEIINRKKYRMDVRGAAQKEKDIAALANALSDLTVSTRKARTAVWCALQLASNDLPQQCIRQAKAVARRRGQGPAPLSKTNVGFHHYGQSELLERDVGFVDYQRDFYNESDHEDCEDESDHEYFDDELNQEVFYNDSGDDLECNVFESGSQEAGCKESDYESYTEVSSDADGKVFVDGSLHGCQFQLQSEDDKLLGYSDEPDKESDYERSCTDAGKETEYKGKVEEDGNCSVIDTSCKV